MSFSCASGRNISAHDNHIVVQVFPCEMGQLFKMLLRHHYLESVVSLVNIFIGQLTKTKLTFMGFLSIFLHNCVVYKAFWVVSHAPALRLPLEIFSLKSHVVLCLNPEENQDLQMHAKQRVRFKCTGIGPLSSKKLLHWTVATSKTELLWSNIITDLESCFCLMNIFTLISALFLVSTRGLMEGIPVSLAAKCSRFTI